MNSITLVRELSGQELMDRYYHTSIGYPKFYLRIPDEIWDYETCLTTRYQVYIYNKAWYLAIKGSETAEWIGSDTPRINQCFR
jgi:hypothetical protein